MVTLGRLSLFASGAILFRYYAVKRDDLAKAEVHSWPDAGVGLLLHGQFDITRFLGVFLRSGPEIFPASRIVKIEGGPNERVGLVCVPLTAGLSLLF